MIRHLKGVHIFAGLEQNALELLLEHTKAQEYAKGDVIVHEGDTSNLLYLIASGNVHILKNFGKADQVELATLGPKDFFGESCILDTLPRPATVQAASHATIFSISSMAFYHLYKMMPAQYGILLLNIARDLSRRLRALDEVFAARH